jgi:hypothetical protein
MGRIVIAWVLDDNTLGIRRPKREAEHLPLSSADVNQAHRYTSYPPPSRDSSVGIANRYRLDGPGIESLWWRDFPLPAPFQTRPGAHPVFCTMGTESFPRAKQPGHGVDHPPSPTAEVKERVQLYFYFPLGLRRLF